MTCLFWRETNRGFLRHRTQTRAATLTTHALTSCPALLLGLLWNRRERERASIPPLQRRLRRKPTAKIAIWSTPGVKRRPTLRSFLWTTLIPRLDYCRLRLRIAMIISLTLFIPPRLFAQKARDDAPAFSGSSRVAPAPSLGHLWLKHSTNTNRRPCRQARRHPRRLCRATDGTRPTPLLRLCLFARRHLARYQRTARLCPQARALSSAS